MTSQFGSKVMLDSRMEGGREIERKGGKRGAVNLGLEDGRARARSGGRERAQH